MKRLTVLVGAAALVVVGAMAATPTSLDAQAAPAATSQQQEGGQAAQQAAPTTPQAMPMMEQMMGSNAKIDELVAAVKAAKGDAKTDALADLVAGLFGQSRHMMGASGMGGMMNMSLGMHGATAGMHQGGCAMSPQPEQKK